MKDPDRPSGLRSRLTFSNVIAMIALFAALGGGVAIAAQLKKNSVGAKQIKKNAVTAVKIKKNAVTAVKIKKGAVNGDKLADGAVSAPKIADGAVNGAKIADGTVGAADLAADEPFHVVGAPGEPAFGNGGDGDCIWSDGTGVLPGLQPTSFYKDKSGRVHFAGVPVSNNGPGGDTLCDNTGGFESLQDSRVFTLPAGDRPDKLTFLTTTNGPDNVTVIVGADEDTAVGGNTIPAGAVIAASLAAPAPNGVLLESLSFRAAG